MDVGDRNRMGQELRPIPALSEAGNWQFLEAKHIICPGIGDPMMRSCMLASRIASEATYTLEALLVITGNISLGYIRLCRHNLNQRMEWRPSHAQDRFRSKIEQVIRGRGL